LEGDAATAPAWSHRYAAWSVAPVVPIQCRLGGQFVPSAPALNPLQQPLALPSKPTETYTAHSTAKAAVQSNEVYLTPCTAVPSINRASASDKRCSLALRRPIETAGGANLRSWSA